MPLHDWAEAESGVFHEVHSGWLIYLRDALNSGRLPAGYRAHAERRAGVAVPDLLALGGGRRPAAGGPAVAEPQTARQLHLHPTARHGRVLTVRYTAGRRLVAVVEVVSPANKDRPARVETFARKLARLLRGGVNVAVLDPHRPGRHDPGGMAAAVCRALAVDPPDGPPADRPFTFAGFRANPPRLFLDDIGVGDPLPATPLFLDGGAFVPLPLEATYLQAVAGTDPIDLPPVAPPPE